jgi:predicted acyltransferase
MTSEQAVSRSEPPDHLPRPGGDSAAGGGAGTRLTSIDALRGFDMFWITGGGAVFGALAAVWPNPFTFAIKRQLGHVAWAGVHFEDLIYPLFLLLIGVVLPFSLSRRQSKGESLGRQYLHFLRRSVLLIVLGSIPAGLFSFTHWPYLGGVLAHIGLCYLPAAILVRHTRWRTRAVLAGAFLVCYWLACLLIPVPGAGAGVFTEDGSLPSFIDHHLITGKLWNEGPASIPSGVVIIVIGSLAGEWLRCGRSGNQKAAGLALAGFAGVIIGLVWSLSFPMIKRVVWSSSYVTFASGCSLLLLALFYWLIDVQGYRRWAFFFVVIGTNAITIYFLQTIIDFKAVAKLFVGGIEQYAGVLSPLVLPLGVLALKWWLLWFFYKRKVFFKL